ncbi:hypothetical protein ANN_21358 [Periplaneta americana]|uniref:Uncharacterized protein n=1 Tax=Periplaneta americana TaxID=6978 RepID=A0ABQ8SFY9_PERAM|nr:hypothetical protein ANN_21358 [Periplaneta americana]
MHARYGGYIRTRHESTFHKRISRHSLWAAAYGYVIHHVTDGSLTASSWTRICTFVSDTSPVPRTVSTENTLGSTPSIWVSLVFWQTSANSIVALSIGAARYMFICLRGGVGPQLVKGSPVYPSGQVQTGVWLMTLHCAPAPQDPGQGSRHFSLRQAKLLGHSELITHSGRQLGGLPVYVGRQEQEGVPPTSWHCEYGPHGDGTHGFTYCGGNGSRGGAIK